MHICGYYEEFTCKKGPYPFLCQLRYSGLKLLFFNYNYKENDCEKCDAFNHNFKTVPIYTELGIIRKALFCFI